MIRISTLTCKHCGHTWIPRQNQVSQCPKCHSRNWDKEPQIKYRHKTVREGVDS